MELHVPFTRPGAASLQSQEGNSKAASPYANVWRFAAVSPKGAAIYNLMKGVI
jgi:hypothetical protein